MDFFCGLSAVKTIKLLSKKSFAFMEFNKGEVNQPQRNTMCPKDLELFKRTDFWLIFPSINLQRTCCSHPLMNGSFILARPPFGRSEQLGFIRNFLQLCRDPSCEKGFLCFYVSGCQTDATAADEDEQSKLRALFRGMSRKDHQSGGGERPKNVWECFCNSQRAEIIICLCGLLVT